MAAAAEAGVSQSDSWKGVGVYEEMKKA